jgi:hypothetical protein
VSIRSLETLADANGSVHPLQNTIEAIASLIYLVRFVVRRDWNFARSGKPAAIFQKLYRSEDPRTPQKIVTGRRQRALTFDP